MLDVTIKAVKDAEKKADSAILKAKEDADLKVASAKRDAQERKERMIQDAKVQALGRMEKAKEDGRKYLEESMKGVEQEIADLKIAAGSKADQAVEAVIATLL